MSVGGVLLEARERAGLSVADVSERTCIRRTLIEEIEHDDFAHCGGDVYARGHVKSIAQALHLDPAPLLVEFDGDHHDPDAPTASGVLDPEHLGSTQRDAKRRTPNWSAAMAVALGAVVVVGAAQLVTSDGDSGSGATSSSEDAAVRDDDASGQEQQLSPSAGPEQSEAPPDESSTTTSGVTVVLTAVDGRSWVSATGKRAGELLESILAKGEEQILRDDRQVKLVVGNAGALRLSVNGRDLGAPGGSGEVVRLTFGPGDPEPSVNLASS